jgi:antagonist of KipI
MNSLVVESPGLLSTVQDLGRPGFGALGVSPSGAADPLALRLGNLLVGNKPGAAALEMTLLGGSFVFPERATIALTGADLDATVNGRAVQMWTAQTIAPGSKLICGSTQNFARGYLAVAGGIRVPRFLGSSSTHLLSGLGGYRGRELRGGDVLQFGTTARKPATRKVSEQALATWMPRRTLRVTEGPQIDGLWDQSKKTFFSSTFFVSESSDRMGIRLKGERLHSKACSEMITEGAPLGAIQVTPSGQPIILFVEQQTTGGYPKVANVIAADLHCLGQLRPRAEIQFQRISLTEARSLWVEQEKLLSSPTCLFE